MTWLAQVRHVMAKDVRQALWPLVLYVAVVAIATMQVVQQSPTLRRPFDFPVTYLVVVIGMFVTAIVVQSDSPTRSDAFWASRPLYPTAVLAAKAALVFGALFGIGMLSQSIVFVWLREPLPQFVRLLVRSAWIYALWLSVAMLIGSITRDLRTFITTLAVIPLAFSFARIPSLFALQRLAAPRTALFAAAAVGAVGTAALLIGVYRTKKNGRAIWMLAATAAACMLLAIFTNPWARASGRIAGGGDQRYAIYLDEMIGPRGLDRLALGIPMPIVSDRYTVIDSALVRIRLNDGNTLLLTSTPHATVTFPALPLPNGIRWIGALPIDGSSGATGIRATRRQLDSLDVGIASVSIDALTWSAQPRALPAIPLRAGARQRIDGKIVRVVKVGTRAEDDTLAFVAMTSVSAPDARWSWQMGMLSSRAPEYALVNLKRGEAVIPVQHRLGSSIVSTALPGLWRGVMISEFSGGILGSPGQPPMHIDQQWIDDAHVLAYDWTPIGQARIHIENVEVRVKEMPNAFGRGSIGRAPPSRSPR